MSDFTLPTTFNLMDAVLALNVFGSKPAGEPPFMLAVSVYEAIKDAVAASTKASPVSLTAPATAENVLKALVQLPH